MHKEKMYPPYISILAHSKMREYATITLAVKGMSEEICFRVSKQFGKDL